MLHKMWAHFMGRMKDEGGWIPAAIAGGSMLLGTVLANQQSRSDTAAANAQSAANQAAANQANQLSSREQMQFQERMSSTAYQRAMADMKSAGLNPMLAFSQGGASAPSGSSYTASPAPVSKPNYQDPLGPAVSSAMDAHLRTQTVQQAAQQVGISQANSTADIALKAAQIAATTTSAKKTAKETEILNSRAKREKLEGDFYGSDSGKTMYYLNQINDAAGGSLDTLNSLKDLINPLGMLSKKLPKNTKIREKLNKKTGEIEKWLP